MAWQNEIKQPAQWWTDNNPTLLNNQVGIESNIISGVETDSGAGKIGNGVTPWNSLGYSFGTPSRTVTDADATAALTDNGGINYLNSALAHSVTFPAACKVANFNCLVVQLGAGTVSLVGTVNSSASYDLAGQDSSAAILYNTDADVFISNVGGAGGGGIGGDTGATDNAVLRSDGTGGATLQNSLVTVSDTGKVTIPALGYGVANAFIALDNGSQISSNSDGAFWFGNSTGVFAAIVTVQSILEVANSYQFAWDSGATAGAGACDTGFARYSAGVIRATDGLTGIKGFMGGGAAVASASAMPVPTGRVFHVTGTTNITSITSTNFQAGAVITLIFDGVLTFTDGSNLKLAGDFVTSADDTITLVYDGTNWYEMCRSVN